ncbi:MAG TPA: hypothetical protein DCR21_07805, partial [Succinivibrionaceae bacterium]|nr:hypothetical protein [Succinivibrionaceae bacterium]
MAKFLKATDIKKLVTQYPHKKIMFRDGIDGVGSAGSVGRNKELTLAELLQKLEYYIIVVEERECSNA